MADLLVQQIAKLICNPSLQWTAPDHNNWVWTKHNWPTQFVVGKARDKLVRKWMGYLLTISLIIMRSSELSK